MRNYPLRFLLLPLLLLLASYSYNVSAFSVTEEPYASPAILHSKYKSVLAYLNKQGLRANFKPAMEYSDYIAMSKSGMIDMAFASAGLAQLLRQKFGFKLVAASVQTLDAVLFVSKQSDFTDLKQLKGHNILIPEAYDIVSEIARDELIFPLLQKDDAWVFEQQSKVDHIIYKVLSGREEAGIVAGYDLQLIAHGLQSNVRILYRSEPVTAHYILLRNLDHFTDIQTWMVNFHQTAFGEQYKKDFGDSRFIAPQPHHLKELDRFSEFAGFLYEQSMEVPSQF